MPLVVRVGLVIGAEITLGTEPRRACEVVPTWMGERGEGASSSYGLEAPSSEAVDTEDWRARFLLRVRKVFILEANGWRS